MADLSINKEFWLNEVSFKNTQKKETNADNKPSNDEGKKKSIKLMLGATALAAVTIGGIILHKGNVAKEAEKLAKDLKHQRTRMSTLFNDLVTEEEIAAKLKEIDKLSPTEQKKAYNALDRVRINIQELKDGNRILRRGMKELPEDVKQEMATGNWIKAGELYEAHVQELPNTFRASNLGATVEESIPKVFGSETKVRPHNYDLSKEGNEIISLRNAGGYYDVVATREGLLYEPPVTGLSRALTNVEGFFQKATHTDIGDSATIIHGISEGKYVTLLKMPDKSKDAFGRDLSITLCLTSNTRKPSPAQKDLLSLAEHPERFNIDLIDKLTLKTKSNVTGAQNMDYDLALSVIQSMAKG